MKTQNTNSNGAKNNGASKAADAAKAREAKKAEAKAAREKMAAERKALRESAKVKKVERIVEVTLASGAIGKDGKPEPTTLKVPVQLFQATVGKETFEAQDRRAVAEWVRSKLPGRPVQSKATRLAAQVVKAIEKLHAMGSAAGVKLSFAPEIEGVRLAAEAIAKAEGEAKAKADAAKRAEKKAAKDKAAKGKAA